MSPNQDETAVHGCYLHLHCSCSGNTVVCMRKDAGQTCRLESQYDLAFKRFLKLYAYEAECQQWR